MNLYSAPSRGLLRGAPDSSTAKKYSFESNEKRFSKSPREQAQLKGSPFQTTGPTTEKARFCIVAVRANGTRSTPFSAERRGGGLEYPKWGNKALAGSLGRGPVDIATPGQQSCTQCAAGWGASAEPPAYSWRHDQIWEFAQQDALQSARLGPGTLFD